MSTEKPAQVVTVLSTFPDAETAREVGTLLVRERLAACANVVPGVTSIFRWDDEIRADAEVLVVLKTTADAAERLGERIAALHPYDVPEVLTLDVAGGHAPYLQWVDEEVGERA